MSAFFRYMASLAIHIAWQRAGNRGGVPPIRLPRRGPVNLPVIGPWQMMIAMWVLRKVWAAYGDDVKGHMLRSRNKLVNQVGSSLPGSGNAPGAPAADDAAATATGVSPVGATAPAPRAPSPRASSPRARPNLDTQVLPAQPAAGRTGSVLARLRGSAPHASSSNGHASHG